MTAEVDLRPVLARDVVLDGAGVRLRAPREDDVPALVELGGDPAMSRWVGVPTPYDDAAGAAFLARTVEQNATGERRTWVTERDGAHAGLCALRTTRTDGVLEVSYAAHPAHRGQGATTEAVRTVCGYAFEQGAQAVLWHALVGHFASRRVAWHCGFEIGGPAWRPGPATRGHRLEQVWSGLLRAGEPMQPRHRWLAAPVLELGDLRLRPFRESDARHLPLERDEAAERYLRRAMPTQGEYAQWLLDRRTWMAEGDAVFTAVTDAATDAVLGGLLVFRLRNPWTPGSGGLGYWLLEHARGRGVAGRAVDAAVTWAFGSVDAGGLGLRRLAAEVAAPNRASARVLRRAGFALVGTERSSGGPDGAPDDRLLFDLLADDDRAACRVEPGRIPVMETERFRLREWRDDDVPGPGEGPDADSRRFMPPRVHPDAESFPAWLAMRRRHRDEGEQLNWCLADKETDHALGNVVVFGLGPVSGRFQGELGYWLHPPARGRGALREVLPLVVDHAFRPVADGGLGLARLHAGTDLDNAASQALLLRLGFRRWGQDRQAFRNGTGEITDGAFFELLATDDRTDQRHRGGAELSDVTLEGRHVRLRPWREDDVPRIVDACTDPRTRHWLSSFPEPYAPAQAREFLARRRQRCASGEALELAVADPGSDLCLGAVSLLGLLDGDPTSAEVGYWTHPDARGRGVMTEAVELLVAHAMRPPEAGGLGLRRLQLSTAAGNAASVHVAQAAGFRRAGVRRQAQPRRDGGFDDVVDFDLLDPAWSSPEDH